MMRIGIFGGSFNPPHNMHKKIMMELLCNGYIDKGIYVPTGDSYNKKDLIKFIDRFKMVEIMVNNSNVSDSLLVSDIGNKGEYQYTYQVMDYFKKIYRDSDIYFICGSDNLLEFDTWMEYKYILDNYNLLVIRRNNDNIDKILDKYDEYRDKIIITDILMDVLSSTYIRKMIENDDIIGCIDNDVYKYIRDNNLYGASN